MKASNKHPHGDPAKKEAASLERKIHHQERYRQTAHILGGQISRAYNGESGDLVSR